MVAIPPVVLMTDMGASDWYVGVMKAVVNSLSPETPLLDLCHHVRRQNVADGAFILHVAYGYYPAGTIFLAVVDPQVGSERRALAATDGRFFYVGPDNGLFSYVMEGTENWRAHSLENPALALPLPSSTFHGRDLFAPAAGHLARGVALEDFGPAITNAISLGPVNPSPREANSLEGRVLYIDHFGNLITNISRNDLPGDLAGEKITARVKKHEIQGVAPHYAAVPQNHPLLYWGSTGMLEIAVNYGSAARKWDIGRDERVEVRW